MEGFLTSDLIFKHFVELKQFTTTLYGEQTITKVLTSNLPPINGVGLRIFEYPQHCSNQYHRPSIELPRGSTVWVVWGLCTCPATWSCKVPLRLSKLNQNSFTKWHLWTFYSSMLLMNWVISFKSLAIRCQSLQTKRCLKSSFQTFLDQQQGWRYHLMHFIRSRDKATSENTEISHVFWTPLLSSTRIQKTYNLLASQYMQCGCRRHAILQLVNRKIYETHTTSFAGYAGSLSMLNTIVHRLDSDFIVSASRFLVTDPSLIQTTINQHNDIDFCFLRYARCTMFSKDLKEWESLMLNFPQTATCVHSSFIDMDLQWKGDQVHTPYSNLIDHLGAEEFLQRHIPSRKSHTIVKSAFPPGACIFNFLQNWFVFFITRQ